MAYVNSDANGRHGIFESSRLKASDVGRLYDCLVRAEVSNSMVPIEVDNGVPVKIGEFTGNGLQEVYATIAGVGDKIAVLGTPTVVKDARVASDEVPSKFTNKAGRLSKGYEVLDDDYEVFAVADYQFTDASKANIAVGRYVTIDGNGMYVAVAANASAPKFAGENGATNGFIGKVHSIGYDNLAYTTIVRIQCLQNVQIS